jgi:hypothetical protein
MILITSLCDSFERVVICVDGLNECERGEDTILASKLLWMRSHGALVFVVTVTHGELPEKCGCNDHITATFRDEMQLVLRAAQDDIRACVVRRLEAYVAKEGPVPDVVAREMVEQCVSGCGGMFLMAQMMLDRSLRYFKHSLG